MELPNSESHEIDQRCLEPYEYIASMPGKNVRSRLIDAFQQWLSIPEDFIPEIKDIIGSLHNASLLVDDIEDNSKLRRGVPVAHAIYGVAATINCANYVYFIAFQKAVQLGIRHDGLRQQQSKEEEKEEERGERKVEDRPSSSSSSSSSSSCTQEVIEIMTTELLNLHRGQGQEIVWRDAVQCPSEEDYCKMVLDKTGGLFRLAVKLMQVFSENKTDFTTLLDKLALYFQIRDDYVNLASLEYMKSKSFCEDLTEGKFSFPIIHCVLSDLQDHRMLNILKQKTEDVEIKRYAVNFMRETGSLRYTRERIVILRDSLLSCIEEYGGHRDIQGLIVYLDQQLESCDEENGIETTKVVLETI